MNRFFAEIGSQSNNTDFSMEGGEFEVIPDDTNVVATCEQARNATWNDRDYIELRWRVHQPEEYKNRVHYHKVYVYDENETRRHRQKRMLAAIANNAGGRLFEEMARRGEEAPSEASLQALTNVPMVLKMGVFSPDLEAGETEDDRRHYNWVKGVSKYTGTQEITPKPATSWAKAPTQIQGGHDDIPF